ncbi:GspE/PulE family protein [Patulibacter sp. NPDC049589]|uniref:GspE/PulE family protein n=1 Tax=Patulibacter sp. NPDC049589 TaxID=3154731 RepID=UPI00342C3D57
MLDQPSLGAEEETSAAAPPRSNEPELLPLERALSSPRLELSGLPLTEILVARGAEPAKVREAVAAARERELPLDRAVVELGVCTGDGVARALADRFGLDHLDLAHTQPDPSVTGVLSADDARAYQAVPVARLGSELVIAIADPSNMLIAEDLAMLTRSTVRLAVAAREDVQVRLASLTHLDDAVKRATPDAPTDGTGGQDEAIDVRSGKEDAPVINLVNTVLAQAIERRASDVHFSPLEHGMRVRFRIDGVLSETATVPKALVPGLVSRLKVMADLDIAERRRSQDGRVSISIDGRGVDLRAVTLPSVHGEAVVLRILDRADGVITLDRLGMGLEDRSRFEAAFSKPYGAILATGPTGSGKSTSLYAALQRLNTADRHIVTIEDPVERQLDGVTQVQVNNRAGVTFANGLRSMMRADPDVIMVGEIRDAETAKIAVESALTGHLVLSTLHTNDAPTAVTRLLEMGVEPFLVASAIECVVAQRLARSLCETCKRPVRMPAELVRQQGFEVDGDVDVFEAVGCGRCGDTGYRGRVGLYEVMVVDEEMRSMIVERAPIDRITAHAVASGMVRLRQDGLRKVLSGKTSFAEITRVTGDA